jgi:hypothetical protein
MKKKEPIPTEQAALRLWNAFTTQKPCAPVRDLIGSDDIASPCRMRTANKRIESDFRKRASPARLVTHAQR